jgi:putative tryptophan/tyrosine transport system substrate-binding protein
MDRRHFLLTSLAGAVAVPLAGEAQPVGKVYRVGVLALVSVPVYEDVFRQSLRDIGYIEGGNLILEWRWADGKAERLPALAAELVERKVDLILAPARVAALAAKAATTTIPIVMAVVGSPEESGLVATLSRPGGNVTGLTSDPGGQIAGKMVELLKQAAPTISRIALLSSPGSSGEAIWIEHADTAARALGLRVQGFIMKDPTQASGVLADIMRAKQDALLMSASALVFSQRRIVLDFALTRRLPSVSPFRPYADDGGLIAYGVDLKDLFRRVTVYVDRILRGHKPADLPVEQPSKFELVVNLKTAKALGLTIPPALLLQADHVIE